MLIWILIIFALAVIFGVIKVETLKNLYTKVEEFVKTKMNKMNDLNNKEPKEVAKAESSDTEKAEKTIDSDNNQE